MVEKNQQTGKQGEMPGKMPTPLQTGPLGAGQQASSSDKGGDKGGKKGDEGDASYPHKPGTPGQMGSPGTVGTSTPDPRRPDDDSRIPDNAKAELHQGGGKGTPPSGDPGTQQADQQLQKGTRPPDLPDNKGNQMAQTNDDNPLANTRTAVKGMSETHVAESFQMICERGKEVGLPLGQMQRMLQKAYGAPDLIQPGQADNSAVQGPRREVTGIGANP